MPCFFQAQKGVNKICMAKMRLQFVYLAVLEGFVIQVPFLRLEWVQKYLTVRCSGNLFGF